MGAARKIFRAGQGNILNSRGGSKPQNFGLSMVKTRKFAESGGSRDRQTEKNIPFSRGTVALKHFKLIIILHVDSLFIAPKQGLFFVAHIACQQKSSVY